MTTALDLAPRDVPMILNYFKALNDEPPHRYVRPPVGKPSSNIGIDPQPAVVRDVRGHEAEFSLDKNGFQYVHWSSVEKDFTDDNVIKEKYYPEVERILKEVTGTKRVYIFDHVIRRTGPKVELSDPKNSAAAAEMVHIDQSYEASVGRVKYHLPADADRLLQSRVRLINVWRPIANPVAHKPLAFADWRTLDAADLVSISLIYPHRTSATFSVKYNPTHKLGWYYLGGQTREEIALIKCYDSKTDRARLTPHTAFTDAGSPADAPHRQSIEVRALVFDAE